MQIYTVTYIHAPFQNQVPGARSPALPDPTQIQELPRRREFTRIVNMDTRVSQGWEAETKAVYSTELSFTSKAIH